MGTSRRSSASSRKRSSQQGAEKESSPASFARGGSAKISESERALLTKLFGKVWSDLGRGGARKSASSTRWKRRGVISILACLSAVGFFFFTSLLDNTEEQAQDQTQEETQDEQGKDAEQTTTLPSDEEFLLLKVATLSPDIPDYRRKDWMPSGWRDEDHDCQNTRVEVLVAEALDRIDWDSSRQCKVQGSRWYDYYTGEYKNDPSELDIDHLVPLANAHRSGGWAWSLQKKRDYANDLTANHLIAVDSGENRKKGAKGPESWRPLYEEYWCEYAWDWINVKVRWELTVTMAEHKALEDMLATCSG